MEITIIRFHTDLGLEPVVLFGWVSPGRVLRFLSQNFANEDVGDTWRLENESNCSWRAFNSNKYHNNTTRVDAVITFSETRVAPFPS